MSSIDCFVVVKGVVADFLEFISIEAGSEVINYTGIPVLCVPILGLTVDCFFG